MAEHNEIYRRAQYYDIAFQRDVHDEIDFLLMVYRQFNRGKEAQSLLDLACGPGYHARTFAALGRKAIGLDLREEMLALAADLSAKDGVEVEWIAADMRHLNLIAPVDIAINAFDGIDCLLTNDDLLAHLRAIANNLTDGGLYFIDLTHPRFTDLNGYAPFARSGERDGVRVEVNWTLDPLSIDPLAGIAYPSVEMCVQDNGTVLSFQDHAPERLLSAQELILLAKCAGGLQPVAWYGAYDTGQNFDQSIGATRMIAVLQKVQ